MVATRIRVTSVPPIGGSGAGVLLALLVAFAPPGLLERAVEMSGVAAPASLGPAMRSSLALVAGLFAGATVWAALFLLFGPGGVFAREERGEGLPTVRRADAHPDAPTRRPLFAADDLGAPPPPDIPATDLPPIERDLPRDLDQPLAVFDPAAVRAAPMEPVRPVPPLAPRSTPLRPGERIASVELPARGGGDTGALSIEALLKRLEEGAARHQLRRAG